VRIDALLDAPPSVQRQHVLGGEVVTVRPARLEDAGMIAGYIRALSFASRYTRFLGPVNELTPGDLYRITHGDDAAPPALIVVSGDADARSVVGEARYALDGITCEFALSVADPWRRKGLGTLLIGIIEGAKLLGAHYLVGDVLRSNQAMLALAHKLGFAVTRSVLDDRLFKITKRLLRLDGARIANEGHRRTG
jgi:acetyltransferase